MRISEGEGEINYNHHSKAYKPIANKRISIHLNLDVARSRRPHKHGNILTIICMGKRGRRKPADINQFTFFPSALNTNSYIIGRRAPISIEMEYNLEMVDGCSQLHLFFLIELCKSIILLRGFYYWTRCCDQELDKITKSLICIKVIYFTEQLDGYQQAFSQ